VFCKNAISWLSADQERPEIRLPVPGSGVHTPRRLRAAATERTVARPGATIIDPSGEISGPVAEAEAPQYRPNRFPGGAAVKGKAAQSPANVGLDYCHPPLEAPRPVPAERQQGCQARTTSQRRPGCGGSGFRPAHGHFWCIFQAAGLASPNGLQPALRVFSPGTNTQADAAPFPETGFQSGSLSNTAANTSATGLGIKQPPSGKHLVQHHSECPDVGPPLSTDLAARLCLWRHVRSRAQNHSGFSLRE